MFLHILCKSKPVVSGRLTADYNFSLIIFSFKCFCPKIERIESFHIILKRKNSSGKFESPVIKSPCKMCLASNINSYYHCCICYLLNLLILCIIHFEPSVLDCFVYIRQDATQSYIEVLFSFKSPYCPSIPILSLFFFIRLRSFFF